MSHSLSEQTDTVISKCMLTLKKKAEQSLLDLLPINVIVCLNDSKSTLDKATLDKATKIDL